MTMMHYARWKRNVFSMDLNVSKDKDNSSINILKIDSRVGPWPGG